MRLRQPALSLEKLSAELEYFKNITIMTYIAFAGAHKCIGRGYFDVKTEKQNSSK